MPARSMERFVHVKNLQLLRARLTRTTRETESKQIVKMIEAEEAKCRLANRSTKKRSMALV